MASLGSASRSRMLRYRGCHCHQFHGLTGVVDRLCCTYPLLYARKREFFPVEAHDRDPCLEEIAKRRWRPRMKTEELGRLSFAMKDVGKEEYICNESRSPLESPYQTYGLPA